MKTWWTPVIVLSKTHPMANKHCFTTTPCREKFWYIVLCQSIPKRCRTEMRTRSSVKCARVQLWLVARFSFYDRGCCCSFSLSILLLLRVIWTKGCILILRYEKSVHLAFVSGNDEVLLTGCRKIINISDTLIHAFVTNVWPTPIFRAPGSGVTFYRFRLGVEWCSTITN
jgi:hypothetical protein